MARQVPSLVILASFVAVACACAVRATPGDAAASPRQGQSAVADACELSGEPDDVIRLVGLTEPVEPAHAPWPSNESERVLFRQLYETLVRVDCEGRVLPGLAASWRFDPSGQTWIVTLRGNARFTDTMPVTTSDVIASWSVDASGGDLRPEARVLVSSVTAVDERSLAIALRSPHSDAPVALAHADLAVAKAVAGSAWPAGTKSARVDVDREPGALPGSALIGLVRVAPRPSLGERPDLSPYVTFIVAPHRDRRDLLDEGVDLMITREPATLDYAETLPQYRHVPMAWLHTRVFAARGNLGASLTAEQRQALAADAVRGEARGAEGPFWWQALADCPVTPRQPPSPPQISSSRIVYDANDGAARDLAERLVGLAGARSAEATSLLDALLPDRANGTVQRSMGLTGNALAVAQRRGNDAGYVLTIDRAPLDACAELQRAVEAIEWLTPDAMVPLVDTRLQAILRRGHGRAIVEGDGALLIPDTSIGR